MDNQVELTLVPWFNTKMVYPQIGTYLRTNLAQSTATYTLLMCTITLTLSQTTTNKKLNNEIAKTFVTVRTRSVDVVSFPRHPVSR